jgi:hypothetical protein
MIGMKGNQTMKNTYWFLSLLVVVTLMGCAPESIQTPTEVPTTVTSLPATAIPTAGTLPEITFDLGGIASGYQIENVPAMSADEDAPYWAVLPAYTRITLTDYPVNGHMEPQIFVYPMNDLISVNQTTDGIVASLQTLIQSPQEIPIMPFMPVASDVQIMHPQIQYLDFKNGQGMRYLTEYSNGISPISNAGLIYTYQGITSDGQYYVAAVLPVNHPSLPADSTVTGNEPPTFRSNYQQYKTDTAQSLNIQAPATFAPDLTLLDAIMSSLEID